MKAMRFLVAVVVLFFAACGGEGGNGSLSFRARFPDNVTFTRTAPSAYRTAKFEETISITTVRLTAIRDGEVVATKDFSAADREGELINLEAGLYEIRVEGLAGQLVLLRAVKRHVRIESAKVRDAGEFFLAPVKPKVPELTLSPAAITTAPSVTLTGLKEMFTGINLNGKPVVDSNEAKTFTFTTTLSEGKNELLIAAVNPEGIEGPPLLLTLTLDRTKPDAVSFGVAGAPAAVSNTTIALSLAANGADEMMIATDAAFTGGVWIPYETSVTLTLPNVDGVYTFYAKFRDAARNESGVLSASVTLDRTPPSAAAVTVVTGAFTSLTSITLAPAAVGADEMQIGQDGVFGAWIPYATSVPFSLTGADGVKVITAKFRDATGNVTQAQTSVTLDRVAPQVTSVAIQGSPSAVSTTALTLDIAVTGASEMAFASTSSQGANPWEPIAATRAYIIASNEGMHGIWSWYRDQAGNVVAGPQVAVLLDRTPPAPTSIAIQGSPPAVSSPAVTLVPAATGAVDMQISESATFQGEAWQAYSTSHPFTLTGGDGSKTIYARFRDAVGNVSLAVSTSVVLDVTPPSVPGVPSLSASAVSDSVTLTWSPASDGGTGVAFYDVEKTNDGGANWFAIGTTAGTSLVYPTTINGAFQFRVRARDGAGRIGAYSGSSAVLTVDLYGPTVVQFEVLGAPVYVNSASVTLAISAPDNVLTTEMMLSDRADFLGAAWQPYATTAPFVLSAGDGAKTIYSRFRDNLGNYSTVGSYSVVLDTTPPDTSFFGFELLSSNAYWDGIGNTVIVGAGGAGTFDVVINSFDPAGVTEVTFPDLGPGWGLSGTDFTPESGSLFRWTYSFSAGASQPASPSADAWDGAGVRGSATFNVLVDSTPPSGGSISYGNGFTNSAAVSINFDAGTDATGVLAWQLQRQSASLVAGACGTYSSFSNVGVTSPASPVVDTLPATGCYRYQLIAVDLVENQAAYGTSDEIQYDADTITGAAVSITGSPTATNTATVGVDLAATGAAEYQLSEDPAFAGASWAPFVVNTIFVLSGGDGVKTVYARFRTAAGSLSGVQSATVELDTQAPSVNAGVDVTTGIASLLDGVVTGATTVSWTQQSGSGTVSFGTPAAQDTTVSADTDGIYVLRLTATDAAGNSAFDEMTLTWASTPPTATLSGAPSVASNAGTLNITVGGTGVVAYRYKFGAGLDCTVATGYGAEVLVATAITDSVAAVPNGSVVKVCAVGKDGNGIWQPFAGATEVSWTRDTNGPVPGGTPVFSANPANSAVTISWTAASDAESSVASYFVEESTDGISFYTISTTFTTSLLHAPSEGTYYYRVVANDAAGNSTYSAVSAALTIDLTAPDSPSVTISGAPSAVSTTSVTLNLLAGGSPVEMQISEDPAFTAATWQAYATSSAFSLAVFDGTKTVYARFRDQAGNISASGSTSVELDTTPPNTLSVVIDGAPTAVTSTSVTVTVSASGAAQFELAADAAFTVNATGFQDMAAATGFPFLLSAGDGTKNVFARFRDAVGNTSGAVATNVQLDSTPPTLTAVLLANDAIGGWINAVERANTGNLVALNASGFTASAYKLVAFGTTCDGSLVYGAPAGSNSADFGVDGSYQVCVRLTDTAGWTVYGASPEIRLDTSAPLVFAPVNFATNVSTVVSAVVTGATTFAWTKTAGPGSAFFADASSFATNVYADIDGMHMLRMTAADAAGNAAFDEVEMTWDVTPPPVPSGLGVAADPVSGPVVFGWNPVTDNLTGVSDYVVKLSTDGGNTYFNYGNTTATSMEVPLSEGNYYFTVFARDGAYNWGTEATPIGPITVDQTPPTSGVVSFFGDPAAVNTTAVTLSLTSDGTEMQVSEDPAFAGASWQPFASTLPFTLSAGDGSKTVYARFRDTAGNINAGASASVVLDTGNPSSIIESPTDLQVSNSLTTISGTATDSGVGVAGVSLLIQDQSTGQYWDGISFTVGQAWVTATYAAGTWSYTHSLPSGTYLILSQATDAANNPETPGSPVTFTYDIDPPTPPGAPSFSADPVSSPVTISWTGSTDGASAIDYYIVEESTDGFTWFSIGTTQATSFEHSLVSSGSYYYRVTAVDVAGNQGGPSAGSPLQVDVDVPWSGTVDDGTAADVDWINSQFMADANWTGFFDIETSIADYQWAIGTIPGWDDAMAFTSTGGLTSGSTFSLALATGVQYYVTVRAFDAAGNYVEAYSDGFTVDTSLPSDPTSFAAAPNPSTGASVTLSWVPSSDLDSGVVGYELQNTTTFANYTTAGTSYTITGLSENTHNLQVRAVDAAGNFSNWSTLQAIVDQTPPTQPGTPTFSANPAPGPFSLSWGASTDSGGAGLKYYVVFESTDGTNFYFIGNTTSTTYFVSRAEGTYHYRVRARDNADNASTDSPSAMMTVDQTPPSSISVSVVGPTITNAVNQMLALAAVGASEMQVSESPIFAGASWTPFTTSTGFTLVGGDGVKSIYARFRDLAGNVSASASTTVTLDTAAPVLTDANINGGATAVSTATVTLNLTSADSFQMNITGDAGAPRGWVPFQSASAITLATRNGLLVRPFGTDSYARDVTVQPDGKVIVVGYALNANEDWVIARFNPEGTLDTSFGAGTGIVTVQVGSLADYAYSVLLQNDGKILVAGSFNNGTKGVGVIMRFNANGTVDTAYGPNSNGKTFLNIGGSTNDGINSIQFDGGGKLIAIGWTFNGTTGYDLLLSRFDANGNMDATFNNPNGYVTTDIASQNQLGSSTVVQSDGKIVASGYHGNGTNNDFLVARYTAAGVLDTGFNTTGYRTTTVGSGNDSVNRVLLQPDGKILAVGSANNGQNRIALARYTATGALDTSFNTSGFVLGSFSTNDSAGGATLLADGKILVGGYAGNDFVTARFNANGSLDTTYAINGSRLIDLLGYTDTAYRFISIGELDGYIVGRSGNGSGNHFSVARIDNTTGKLFGAFGSSLVEGTKTVYIRTRDLAGNTTLPLVRSVEFDVTPPSSPAVYMTGYPSYISSSAVQLNFAAIGAAFMRYDHQSNFAFGNWVPFASQAPFTFPGGDGTKTIYAQYRDVAGNIGSPVSASTYLDSGAPSAGLVYDGNGADIAYQSSASVLNANWSGFFDPQTAIQGYEWAIGTTPGAVDTLPFTNVGGATSASQTGLSLLTGTTYYVTVRARDMAGNTITAVSDGVLVDETAPTGGTVNDGFGADVNYIGSGTFGANWSGFTDFESAVTDYAWAIGTFAGDDSVQAYTSVGLSTSGNAFALSLVNGTTYYVSVRATNAAGGMTIVSSDGAMYDTAGPTVPGSPSFTSPISTSTVTISWSASADAESGIKHYVLEASQNFGPYSQVATSSVNSVNIAVAEGVYTFRVYAIDQLFNQSAQSGISSNLIVDLTAPTGTIAIQGSPAEVSSPSVTLDLFASETADMQLSETADFSGASWQAFASNPVFNLTGVDGAKIIYARFRDSAGNVSPAVSTSVNLVTVKIVSLSTSSGIAGDSITVNGYGFGAAQATGLVQFDSLNPSVISWSDSQVVFTIPGAVGPGSRPVSVTNDAGNTSNAEPLIVNPHIISTTPTSGSGGTVVTINGSNFGNSAGTFLLSGVTSPTDSWAMGAITFTLPNTVPGGITSLRVQAGGQTSNIMNFSVIPGITSVTPATFIANASVTLTGKNFGATQGASTITVGGVTVGTTAWSDTSITFNAPNSLAAGPYNVVVTVNGYSSSGFAVNLDPNITSLTPASGSAPDSISIAGGGFGASQGPSTITVGGTTVSATSWSMTSIQFDIPSSIAGGAHNVVVAMNGRSSNSPSLMIVPKITSAPSDMIHGQPISIGGVNFGATQGASTITVGGTNVTPTGWSDTGITFNLPGGTPTGAQNIVVSVGGQSSPGYSVNVFGMLGISPATVTIAPNGSYTFAGTGGKTPYFYAVVSGGGTINSSTGEYTAPPGPDSVTIRVTDALSQTADATVTVDSLSPPSITSLTPLAGAPGSLLTISGMNFGASQGPGDAVYFDDVSVTTVQSWSESAISVYVPAYALPGTISVYVRKGPNLSGTYPFEHQRPYIDLRYPFEGTVGTQITLFGRYFGGSGSVAVNGVTATVLSAWANDTVTIAVPPGTVKGPVKITLNGSNGTANEVPYIQRANDLWVPMSEAPEGRNGAVSVWSGTEMYVWGGQSGVLLNDGARYNPGTDSWLPISRGPATPQPRKMASAAWTGKEFIVWGGIDVSPSTINTGGKYDPASDTWTAMTTSGALTARSEASAVWTGNQVIFWGGCGAPDCNFAQQSDGAGYNPTTDSWDLLPSTGTPPSGRYMHSAVLANDEMIIWGGGIFSGAYSLYNDGARYRLKTRDWVAMSTTGAPAARMSHSTVWTGDKMIVWGGADDVGELNSGGLYDPLNDTWSATSTGIGVPTARQQHSAVWTGTEMLVWGGSNAAIPLGNGAKYDPVFDTWSAMSSSGAPAARSGQHTAFTGKSMVIWGGAGASIGQFHNTGGQYDVVSDTWSVASTAGEPAARKQHTAVWTGSEMVVWGGDDDTPGAFYASGAIYDPATHSWSVTLEDGTTPSGRIGHKAVWTGNEMIVWGGENAPGVKTNTGGKYNPASDTWSAISTIGAPTARIKHGIAFGAGVAVVWGGNDGAIVNTGSRYNPVADSWATMNMTNGATLREDHIMAWTGSKVLVAGGWNGTSLSLTTNLYDPVANAWASGGSLTGGYRNPATAHSNGVVFLYGGMNNLGAAIGTGHYFNIATNQWLPMGAGGPSARQNLVAAGIDGAAYFWGGSSSNIAYGDGMSLHLKTRHTPVSGNYTAVIIASGQHFSCAIDNGNNAKCWGNNTNGKLGDNTITNRSMPTTVASGGTYSDISAGHTHACAIITGSVYCWGDNANGQVGDGSITERHVPTLVAANWSDVSAGGSFTCGVQTDGTLWCWGANSSGQLGLGDNTARSTPTKVGVDTTWTKVETGSSHACGLKSNNTLYCWGLGSSGQLGVNSTASATTPQAVTGTTWIDVETQGYHTCALKTDSTLWCWGANIAGQIGDNTTVNRLIPTQVNADPDWAQVATSLNSTCALKANGTLWCWGDNADGEFGSGSFKPAKVPMQVDGATNWAIISGGQSHFCGARSDNSVWCSGTNTSGQRGDGTILYDAWKPMDAIEALNPREHATAVAANGDMLIWGGANGTTTLASGAHYSALAKPLAPSAVTSEANTGYINLIWSAVPNATAYIVLDSTTPGGPYNVGPTVYGTSYSYFNICPATYYFVVRAVNAAGESFDSPERSGNCF